MSGLLSYIWSNLDWTSAAVGIVTYYIVRYLAFKGYFSGKNYAPGFFGVPLFGVAPYFFLSRKTVCEKMRDFHAKYGPIIRYNGIITVVSGAKEVKKIFNNDDVLGRPQKQTRIADLDDIFDNSILNLEGELWKKQRRFSLYTLRDLGFGKTAKMEDHLQEEIRELISILEKSNGDPIDAHKLLVSSTSNNISSLLFGERLPFDHPQRIKLNESLSEFIDKLDRFLAVSFIPGLLHIYNYFDIGVIKEVKDIFRSMKNTFEKYIDDHKQNLDRDHPGDYIDHYLIQAEKDPVTYSDTIAVGNCSGFFQAGSATVRTTLEYLLHLMASRPDIQEKVFDEINRVVGVNREVTWADAKDLPYTNAVITERHRYYSVTPFGVQRKTLKDTNLFGYDVPAGTVIAYNLDSVNFDESIFPDPYQFKPERFLDSEGNLCNIDKVWTFALGKRACPGESLAVLEVFLYFSNLMQRFRLEPETPLTQIKFKPLRSFITEVVHQKIRYTPRASKP